MWLELCRSCVYGGEFAKGVCLTVSCRPGHQCSQSEPAAAVCKKCTLLASLTDGDLIEASWILQPVISRILYALRPIHHMDRVCMPALVALVVFAVVHKSTVQNHQCACLRLEYILESCKQETRTPKVKVCRLDGAVCKHARSAIYHL